MAKDIYEMVIEAPEIAAAARPGQFVNLRLSSRLDPLLRRPISFHKIDAAAGTFTILYLIAGQGTALLSRMEAPSEIDVLGPLGNGWTCSFPGVHAVLIGGGIGAAPLYPLAQALRDAGKEVQLILGAKSGGSLTDTAPYTALGVDVRVATDDGSAGFHGFATQLLEQAIAEDRCDYLYACGPQGMLRQAEAIALAHQIPGQVSTETHMGCGLGVCLLCPSKMKAGGYKRTCIDGPVFPIGALDYA